MRKITAEGLQIIKEGEGLPVKALSAYYDVNGWAIGYGMHTYSNGKMVQQYDKITKAFAEAEFVKVVQQFGVQVARLITTSSLSDTQFSAIVAYTYNRGIGALGRSELLKMVNKNPNDAAIPAQFIKEWGTNQQFKTTLIKRRTKESELYKKGSSINTQSILKVLLICVVACWAYLKFSKRKNKPKR